MNLISRLILLVFALASLLAAVGFRVDPEPANAWAAAQEGDLKTRVRAISWLCGHDLIARRGLAGVHSVLKDAPTQARREIFLALGKSGDPAYAFLLLDAARDDAPSRRQAIRALGQLALADCLESLARGSDPATRKEAREALEKINKEFPAVPDAMRQPIPAPTTLLAPTPPAFAHGANK